MSEIIDLFSVTVSRINEYETMSARSVTVSADGILSIQGENHTRLFPAGLWDGFEVKVLTRPESSRRERVAKGVRK